MATYGPALTCNGYNSVTGQCASTSIPSGVSASQYDEYSAGQTPVAPSDPLPSNGSASMNISPGYTNGLLDELENAPFPYGFNFGNTESTATGPATAAGASNSAGIGSLLSIVTDLPRIATIIMGGILITAGVIGLASQHNINIIAPK